MDPGCPSWEYEGHPKRPEVLRRETTAILAGLARRTIDCVASVSDTRPIHRRLFLELTPDGFDHYAGNYRGQQLHCLERAKVVVGEDPRVGCAPERVWFLIAALEDWIRPRFNALDAGQDTPRAILPEPERLLFVTAVAANFFQHFLTIHPYVNGNGHTARFAIWAILVRYGYWPKKFPIDPRPPHPNYTNAISAHRSGNPEPLETLILQSVAAT